MRKARSWLPMVVALSACAAPGAAHAQSDQTPPELATARALSTTEVRVDFNEPVDPGTVQPEDFILDMADVRRPITGTYTAPDGRAVTLVSSGWRPGEAGFVQFARAGAVADPAGNANLDPKPVRVAAAPGDAQIPMVTSLTMRPLSICVPTDPRCHRPGGVIYLVASEPGDATVLIKRGTRSMGTRSYDVDQAGLSKFSFDGRVGGVALPPGVYRMMASLEDPVGNRSPQKSPTAYFRVRRPGKPPRCARATRKPARRGGGAGAARHEGLCERQQTETGTPRGLPPILGIGDNSADTFIDPLFQRLNVRRARLITPWNSIFADPDRLDAWVKPVLAAGIVPLVAFNHTRGDQCPLAPCRAPRVDEYRRAFLAFRERYPSITEFQPWNEANHQTQPTGRRPRLAAEYYNVMIRACPTCTVVAADLLDGGNMARWLRTFQLYVRGRPQLWGLHNYSDTNRFVKSTRTERLLRLVPGDIWLTEAGGLVRFETRYGRVTFPYNESRAARATRYLFELALRFRHRVKRLYLYHWKPDRQNRFDAGLVGPDGSPRPAYEVVRKYRRLTR